MNQQDLKSGIVFNFDNETWCVQNESHDQRGGYVEFNRDRFTIWFNGVIIASFATFPACKKRLEKLMTKWHCEFTTVETL